MDEIVPRRIEVFAPFSEALELTKRILFQPFDLTKWLVIGFAAFLSHLNGGGGGGGFNYNSKLGSGNWNFRSITHGSIGSPDVSGWPAWLLPVLGIGALLVTAVVILMMWLGARGKFIFTDCIVRNRGAIEEPWREFRREGNSYFLFSLATVAIVIFVLGLAGIPLWLPILFGGQAPEGVALFLGLSLLGLVALVIVVGVKLLTSFMIPLMYRRRCRAMEAFLATLSLTAAHPGPIILYLLFSFVLGLAFVMLACLTTCLTCCITALPYVGTVILLPAHVFFMSYLLLFVRQFGPDCDAWGNIVPAAVLTAPVEASPPVEPPPLQP